jgi:hypothetical protein
MNWNSNGYDAILVTKKCGLPTKNPAREAGFLLGVPYMGRYLGGGSPLWG